MVTFAFLTLLTLFRRRSWRQATVAQGGLMGAQCVGDRGFAVRVPSGGAMRWLGRNHWTRAMRRRLRCRLSDVW